MSGHIVDLGKTLLFGTTAWTPPHTLAFVLGSFRMVWDDKSIDIWSPESGTRDVTTSGASGFAPAWSADGKALYFASGSAGQYDPIPVLAGRRVGDRRITVLDLETGNIHVLPHEPGYVEEAARPSRDGTRLLVLRRKTVEASDLRAIPDAPFEIWLTNRDGAHGTALVRISNAFGAYGWLPDPSEWEWSE
jgi:dipeptidyl aminopeptidase/acylaminoacyl peptidase